MSTVARLDVLLGANIAGLAKGLGRGGKLVGGFASKVGMASKKLVGFGSAIVALGAGAGMGAMVKQQMTAIDAAAKLSDQLGIETAALIKLRHAADKTGAGAKTLDAGLATMSKRLGEAARGSGAAKAALGELGLSASSLIAMSPDRAFTTIAEALKGIEEPARRNAIAANIFSKANMGLVNTLALGKKGLAEAGAEAVKLGMCYSRDMARGVEAAGDALGNVRKAMTGFFTRAAIDMGPFIKMWSDDLTKAITGVNSNLDGTRQKLGAVGQVLGGIADFADMLSDSFKAAQAAVTGWAAATARGAAKLYELQTKIPYFGKDYEEMAGVAEAFANDLTRSAKAQERLAVAAMAAEKPSERAARIAKELSRATEETKKNLEVKTFTMPTINLKAMGGRLKAAGESLAGGFGRGFEKMVEDVQGRMPAAVAFDPVRPAALERGTAEAYSATLGAHPFAKLGQNSERQVSLLQTLIQGVQQVRDQIKEGGLSVADMHSGDD